MIATTPTDTISSFGTPDMSMHESVKSVFEKIGPLDTPWEAILFPTAAGESIVAVGLLSVQLVTFCADQVSVVAVPFFTRTFIGTSERAAEGGGGAAHLNAAELAACVQSTGSPACTHP